MSGSYPEDGKGVQRLILNSDGISRYLLYRYPIRLEDFLVEINSLDGTQLEQLDWCVGSILASRFNSKVIPPRGSEPCEYIDDENASGLGFWRCDRNLQHLIKEGHDPLAVVCERAHAIGLRVCADIRMNDGHHRYGPSYAFLKTSWHDEHPELLNPAGNYDYFHKEVRDRILAFVHELAGNYEVDGICLDYSRIPPFFSPEHLEPGRRLMTEMVARAREIVDRSAQSRGRPMSLAAIDYPDMEGSWSRGLDLRTWFAQGLLDRFIPFGRGVAPDMDITEYVEAAGGSACEIYGGIGRWNRHSPMLDETKTVAFTMPELRAMAHRFYQSGASGIHLYDTFVPYQEPRALNYLRALGDRDCLVRANKRYLTNKGFPINVGLLSEGGQAEVTVLMGEDIPAARRAGIVPKVRLLMDIYTNDPVGDVRVSFNGHEVSLCYGPEPSVWQSLPLTDRTSFHVVGELDPDWVRIGKNAVKAEVVRRYTGARFSVKLRMAEVDVFYQDDQTWIGSRRVEGMRLEG